MNNFEHPVEHEVHKNRRRFSVGILSAKDHRVAPKHGKQNDISQNHQNNQQQPVGGGILNAGGADENEERDEEVA